MDSSITPDLRSIGTRRLSESFLARFIDRITRKTVIRPAEVA